MSINRRSHSNAVRDHLTGDGPRPPYLGPIGRSLGALLGSRVWYSTFHCETWLSFSLVAEHMQFFTEEVTDGD
jgi:hypothetical protein